MPRVKGALELKRVSFHHCLKGVLQALHAYIEDPAQGKNLSFHKEGLSTLMQMALIVIMPAISIQGRQS